VLGALITLALLAGQPVERVADIRIQGNTLTADAEVLQWAGITPGAEFTPALLDEIARRLTATGRFKRVEVVKRFASIADPSQVLLIVIVDEGPVAVRGGRDGQPARAVRRRVHPVMVLPLLGSEEGYGFTYGALLSLPNAAGPRTRLSMPVTWGGERRAGI
jgi:cell division septal protein FtsQ